MNQNKYSKVYKGFLIQQTDNNWWEIVLFPDRGKFGVISPGPYSSFNICKHQIDILLREENLDPV